MSTIALVTGREILDSRGNPTVEVEVVLETGRGRRRCGAIRSLDRSVRGGGAP